MWMYDADLYCDDCGRAIADRLAAEGVEDSGDSGDYPQYWTEDGAGASDTPQHCGSGADCPNGEHGAGMLLETGLTDYGVSSVLNALTEHTETGRGNPGVLDQWAALVGEYGLDADDKLILECFKAFRKGYAKGYAAAGGKP